MRKGPGFWIGIIAVSILVAFFAVNLVILNRLSESDSSSRSNIDRTRAMNVPGQKAGKALGLGNQPPAEKIFDHPPEPIRRTAAGDPVFLQ